MPQTGDGALTEPSEDSDEEFSNHLMPRSAKCSTGISHHGLHVVLATKLQTSTCHPCCWMLVLISVECHYLIGIAVSQSFQPAVQAGL